MADETEIKVLSIVANIVKKQANSNNVTSDSEDSKTTSEPQTKSIDIRGKPKSGRFWKTQKEKFSTINKTKGLRQDFAKKTALRLEMKRIKELSKQNLENFKEKQIQKKERRRENIKRAAENKRKSEIVQVITNTRKLKRMKKKQLRFIEKRDTNENIQA